MTSFNSIFKLIGTLLIIGTFFSCTKEKTSPVKTHEKISQDARITRNLLAFKAHLGSKSTGTMEMDSAVWYIEGLMNLENAFNSHKFINGSTLKDSISIIPVNGYLSSDQINSIYSSFQAKVTAFLGSNPQCKTNGVDVYLSSVNLKDGSEKFYLNAEVGEEETETNYLPFGPNDNWFWFMNAGRCTGGGTPYDARILLENRFNSTVGSSEEGYFTDLTCYTIHPDDYPDPNNTFGGHMIFANGLYNPLTCIGYQELNYYLSVFDFLKNDNQPTGKSFSYVEVERDLLVPLPPYPPEVYAYLLHYGIFHEGNPPE